MKPCLFLIFAFLLIPLFSQDIIIENELARLVISSDGYAKSLVYKPLNEECLVQGRKIPISSVTEGRPFQNEIKLAYPTKEHTFKAGSVRREGNKLIIIYDLVKWEAVVDLKITPAYIGFRLISIKDPDHNNADVMEPVIDNLWFLQLPVKDRTYFGNWLNVVWDDKCAVNLLGTDVYARIDAEEREGFRILKAGVLEDVKLRDVGAALITCASGKLLDNIGLVEKDFGLPNGVKSRRHELYHMSYYWSGQVTPKNIDQHIKYAKLGGFRNFMIYYPSITKEARGYSLIGNYDYRDEYPGGIEDVKNMVKKIEAAGMMAGFHFLNTHIGISSRYVTPVPDHRLNIREYFTLSKSLGKSDTVIYTEENPRHLTLQNNRRILKAGTELISYRTYTTTPPYMFTGCQRGYYNTVPAEHPEGFIFGILDVSEYGATSIYLNQNSDLQDEINDRLAEIYKAGFHFVYFDGSEGVNPPYWFHVQNSQLRLWKKLDPEPLFGEGAAKSHFSWHMISGGNAFDIFKPEVLKERIKEHPAVEAPMMQQNFTRVNFGWLGYVIPDEKTTGTQPDMLEYVTSRAAAWDCPVSIHSYVERYDKHPRTADNLEVLRRWEEARAQKWLTPEQKKMLQDLEQEHTLLINEKNQFELVPYDQIMDVAGGSREIRAFSFKRNGYNYVMYWHIMSDKQIDLQLKASDISVEETLGKKIRIASGKNNHPVIPAGKIRYVKSNKLTMEELIEAFAKARII